MYRNNISGLGDDNFENGQRQRTQKNVDYDTAFDLDAVEAELRECEDFMAQNRMGFDNLSARLSPVIANNPVASQHPSLLISKTVELQTPKNRVSSHVERLRESIKAAQPVPLDRASPVLNLRSVQKASQPPKSATPRYAAPTVSAALKSKAGEKPREAIEIERQKEKKEQEELQGCTFAPAVSKTKRQPSRTGRASEDFQQLLEERSRLVRKRRENEHEEELTFQPQINANSRALAARAEQTREERARAKALRRERENAVLKAQQEEQLQRDAEYKQHRDRLARAHAEKRAQEDAAVYDRLTQTPQRNRQRLAVEQAEKEAQECVFTPKINAASRKYQQNQGSFEERQRAFLAKKQLKEERLREQTEKELTFRPQIGPRGESSVLETDAVFERLAAPRARSTAQEEDVQRTPQINARSRALAQGRIPLDQVAAQYHKELTMKREQLAEQARAREVEECSFRPQISAAARFREPHYNFSRANEITAQIAAETQEREERLEAQRRAKEAKELLGTPRAVPRFPNSSVFTPVDVPGMGQVKERTQRIREQKEELLERQKKVFGEVPQGPFMKTVTVPEPFALTETNRIEKSVRDTRKTNAAQQSSGHFVSAGIDMQNIVEQMLKI